VTTTTTATATTASSPVTSAATTTTATATVTSTPKFTPETARLPSPDLLRLLEQWTNNASFLLTDLDALESNEHEQKQSEGKDGPSAHEILRSLESSDPVENDLLLRRAGSDDTRVRRNPPGGVLVLTGAEKRDNVDASMEALPIGRSASLASTGSEKEKSRVLPISGIKVSLSLSLSLFLFLSLCLMLRFLFSFVI